MVLPVVTRGISFKTSLGQDWSELQALLPSRSQSALVRLRSLLGQILLERPRLSQDP
jgi:hypothetical protein